MRRILLFCVLLTLFCSCTTPLGNGWYVKIEEGKRPGEVLTWSYVSQPSVDSRYLHELKDLYENYPVENQTDTFTDILFFSTQQCIY